MPKCDLNKVAFETFHLSGYDIIKDHVSCRNEFQLTSSTKFINANLGAVALVTLA